MTWADWIGRLLCALATFGSAQFKLWAFTPENTLYSVAFNQLLSAVCNTCAIIAASAWVRGKTSFDLQRLAFCAVVVNFLSFLAYWAKSSPWVFVLNDTITVISYVQLCILLWPSNGGIPFNLGRRWLLRLAHLSGARLHLEKRK